MDCWKSSSLFALRSYWSILSSLPSRRNCGTFSFRSSTIYERGGTQSIFMWPFVPPKGLEEPSSPPSSTSSLVGFLAGTVISSLRTVQAAAFPPFPRLQTVLLRQKLHLRPCYIVVPFLPLTSPKREREEGLLPPQLMPGPSTPRECGGGGLSPFTLPLLSLSSACQRGLRGPCRRPVHSRSSLSSPFFPAPPRALLAFTSTDPRERGRGGRRFYTVGAPGLNAVAV